MGMDMTDEERLALLKEKSEELFGFGRSRAKVKQLLRLYEQAKKNPVRSQTDE